MNFLFEEKKNVNNSKINSLKKIVLDLHDISEEDDVCDRTDSNSYRIIHPLTLGIKNGIAHTFVWNVPYRSV